MKTIAWDVDDVLNDLMQAWFELKWIKGNSTCKLRYADIAENPPHRLLGTGIEEYLSSLDEFRLSPLYQQMNPVKEVIEWFSKYGSSFRHIALTSVPLGATSASSQWVFRHFGKWIRTFHFVPSNRSQENLPEYEKDKSDFLEWFGKVDIFIDDNMKNIKSAEKAGVHCILMPRPWNNSENTIEDTLSMLLSIAQN